MRTKKEKENEMIDLSKCTAKTACIKLYKGLKKDGFDAFLLNSIVSMIRFVWI